MCCQHCVRSLRLSEVQQRTSVCFDPEGRTTWHVVYAVFESVVKSGIYFLANVVHVAIEWVRLPDLTLRKVATATVDHQCWKDERLCDQTVQHTLLNHHRASLSCSGGVNEY